MYTVTMTNERTHKVTSHYTFTQPRFGSYRYEHTEIPSPGKRSAGPPPIPLLAHKRLLT
jgi:hypothetical protein